MTRSAEEMFALDAGYFPKEILRAEREADAPLSEAPSSASSCEALENERASKRPVGLGREWVALS
jgi:hypothetical protein